MGFSMSVCLSRSQKMCFYPCFPVLWTWMNGFTQVRFEVPGKKWKERLKRIVIVSEAMMLLIAFAAQAQTKPQQIPSSLFSHILSNMVP
jgi:hypothetical protein